MKNTVIIIILGVLCTLMVVYGYYKKPQAVQQEKEIVVVQPTKPVSYVELYKADLKQDLLTNYPDVSTRNKEVILNTILEEATKYNINPLILYSICYTESSFRHYIEHSQILIEKDKKKISIKAIGLMGIVWEWWGEQLIEHKIAEVKSDLFDPAINIRAGAYIYNELYKQDKHKDATNKDESAMLRFFGGSYPSYVARIDAKIASFIRPKLYRKD